MLFCEFFHSVTSASDSYMSYLPNAAHVATKRFTPVMYGGLYQNTDILWLKECSDKVSCQLQN